MVRYTPMKPHSRQVNGSKAPIWIIFAGMMVVTYCICLTNTQQLAQRMQQPNSSSSSSSSSSSTGSISLLRTSSPALPGSACAAASGQQQQQWQAVAMMMVILGHDNETRHDQYWIAVANRRAYAIQHNISLYLVTDQMGSGEHPAWEKLVALQAVFQHSCADWVWMNDADAYIMNLSLSVMELADNPVQHRNPKQMCNTTTPDIIAAGACLTRMNTGSMLWRNNAWTQRFVADAWHSKFIARPANWWDQAAILHMYKIADNKQHICIVKQRVINAFPNMTGCHDGAGTFKEGDLLVHFPGGMKRAIANSSSKWLSAVPLLPTNLGDTFKHAPIFTVTRFNPAGPERQLGQQVQVRMHSDLYALNSTQHVEFDLFVQPQPEGFTNWGWPIAPEPANHKLNLQRQIRERQQQQPQLVQF